MISAHCGLN
ncbi:rCG58478, partial [Rattus norvegicus]